MLHLNIASNVNICSDLVENENIDLLVERAYKPLLRFYSKHNLKSTLFFAGRTLEILKQKYPSILRQFQSVVKEGTVEVGNHTYGHPVLPLIHAKDARKHIKYSQDLERKLFGTYAKGFLPPEWTFDVTLPSLLKEFGLEWMLLLGVQVVGYYGQGQQDTFVPGRVLGTNKSDIPTFFVYDDPDLWFRNSLFNVFIGIKNPLEFAEETYKKIKPNIIKSKDQLIVFYFDLETPAFNYRLNSKNDPCKNFNRFVEHFMVISDAKPTNITDYLRHHKRARMRFIHPILTKTYKDFSIWWQGSQKLDLETSLVRDLVWKADEKAPNNPELDHLWRLYLLSHSSDARAAASDQRARGLNISGRNIHFGKRERVLEAYEYLEQAEKLAKKILG